MDAGDGGRGLGRFASDDIQMAAPLPPGRRSGLARPQQSTASKSGPDQCGPGGDAPRAAAPAEAGATSAGTLDWLPPVHLLRGLAPARVASARLAGPADRRSGAALRVGTSR